MFCDNDYSHKSFQRGCQNSFFSVIDLLYLVRHRWHIIAMKSETMIAEQIL